MRCVRRAFAVSWVLGTSAGVLFGLLGVQLVTSRITGSRIDPLSRPEVLQALSAGNAEEATAPTPASTAPTDIGPAPPLPGPVSKPAPTPPASAPPRPGATAGPTVTTAAAPPATAPPATTPPAPPPTSAPPATAPPATAPPAPPDRGQPGDTTTAPSEQRTISSRGGRVAVHYQGGEVHLLWARPNDGYDVMVVDDGPQRVYVRFRSGKAWSRVLAFYDRDGQPAEQVDEGRRGKNRGEEDSTTEPAS